MPFPSLPSPKRSPKSQSPKSRSLMVNPFAMNSGPPLEQQEQQQDTTTTTTTSATTTRASAPASSNNPATAAAIVAAAVNDLDTSSNMNLLTTSELIAYDNNSTDNDRNIKPSSFRSIGFPVGRRGSGGGGAGGDYAKRSSSIGKNANKVFTATGGVMKSTVMAPMVAGKALVQGGFKAGNAVVTAGKEVGATVGSTVVYGGKSVVGGGKAVLHGTMQGTNMVLQGTNTVVLGGGKALMDGTQTVAKGVVKGVKKVGKGTIDVMTGGVGNKPFRKQSKWEEGIEVIEELLQPESETYMVMTYEQRKALKNIKKLLLQGPDSADDKMQHVPRDLLYIPRTGGRFSMGGSANRWASPSKSSNSKNRMGGDMAGLAPGERRRVKMGKRGSRSFILEEYAGLQNPASLLKDGDMTDDEDSEEDEHPVRVLPPILDGGNDDDDDDNHTDNDTREQVTMSSMSVLPDPSEEFNRSTIEFQINDNAASRFTPPEFKQLSLEDQRKLCHMLSWDSIIGWDFHIFELNELTRNNPLLFMGWAILGSPYAQMAMMKECGLDLTEVPLSGGYNFMDEFQIPPHKLCNYLRVVEYDYHTDNPYHNAIHAADVMQTLNALIQMTVQDSKNTAIGDDGSNAGAWIKNCPSIKFFTILLSAAVHDIDHPGKTNAFHTKLRTELAVVYNDISVLENWHVARAFARMLDLSLLEANIHSSQVILSAGKNLLHTKQKESENNILCHTTIDEFNTIRNLMIEAVLHTDMTKHFAMVNAAKGTLMSVEGEDITWKVLMYMLHLADISSQAKGAPLFTLWTDRCMAEFFAQGDQEADLGLVISPNCDRSTTNTSESQFGFVKFVVAPAYEVLGEFIPSVKERVLPIITQNLEYWQAQKEKEELLQSELGSSAGSLGSIDEAEEDITDTVVKHYDDDEEDTEASC